MAERINHYLLNAHTKKGKDQHAAFVAGVLHQIAPESHIVVKPKNQEYDDQKVMQYINGNPWFVINTSFDTRQNPILARSNESADEEKKRILGSLTAGMPEHKLWVQSFGNSRLSDQERSQLYHFRLLPDIVQKENIILAVNIENTFAPNQSSDFPDERNGGQFGLSMLTADDLAIIQASTLSALGSDVIGVPGHNQFQRESGTSLSAPVISGVAALLKSAFPELTEWEVRDILLASAEREFHIPAAQENKKGDYFYDPAKTCTSITRNNEKAFVYQEFPKPIYGQGIVNAERAFFFAQLYVCFQKIGQGNDIVLDDIRWLKARFPTLYPVLLEKVRGFSQQKRAQFVSAVRPGSLEWVESLEKKRGTFEQFWCVVEKWQAAAVKEFLVGLKNGKKVIEEANSAAQSGGSKRVANPQYNDFCESPRGKPRGITST